MLRFYETRLSHRGLCQGHAGHLLLAEVPQVIKVRVIADLAGRVALLQQRQKISKDEALTVIKNEDKRRVQWTRYLYKMDLNDPKLYDIVINIDQHGDKISFHPNCSL